METPRVAFVLGGGGLRGAAEVGMVKALAARGITPDIIIGTSVGSLNGAILASEPLEQSVQRLQLMWDHLSPNRVFQESLFGRMKNLFRHWNHLHSNDALQELLDAWLPGEKFDELYTPFQAVAACIETASEHWFTEGSVKDAILASSAVPGLLPPMEIDGLHYIDGGVVNSIPMWRAVELGATEIYVLHVGHIDDPLELPRHPWDVAMVSFEISRRHRFLRAVERVEGDPSVTVHVLPTGRDAGRYNDRSKLWYNDSARITDWINLAEEATAEYLAEQLRHSDRN